MSKTLIVISDDFKNNLIFLSYIFKEYVKKFTSLGDVIFISNNDKDFLLKIGDFTKEYKYITIFVSKKDSTIIAKFLATLCDDFMKLYENGFMGLSNARQLGQASYVSKFKDSFINVVKADNMSELGIIASKQNLTSFYFHIIQADEIELDKTLKKANLNFNLTKITKYLSIVEIYNVINPSLIVKILKNYKNQIFFENSIYEFINNKLKNIQASISFAESSTFGMLANNFASFKDVKTSFNGSVIAYSDEIKKTWLNVQNDIFKKNAQISKESILQMLEGSLQISGASFALAISDFIVEEGKQSTIFIGAAQRNGQKIVEKFSLNGNEEYIKEQSCINAFCLLALLRKDIFLY